MAALTSAHPPFPLPDSSALRQFRLGPAHTNARELDVDLQEQSGLLPVQITTHNRGT